MGQKRSGGSTTAATLALWEVIMGKYVLRRLLMVIPVLLGAIIVVFTINFFSKTDPAMIKLGLSATDTEKLEAMRASMA